jgi:malonyl-CoA O-methyltransferase
MTLIEHPIPARKAYSLWASTYDEENALSTLDELAASTLTPSLAGLALLDAGCGTARRLVFKCDAAPRRAVGIDLVFEMILRSRHDPKRTTTLAVGDFQALPVAEAKFDVVWCRLAAGHIEQLDVLYRELSRVTRRGGFVIITDFHPEASRRGHVRSFRDATGTSRVVEHAVHEAVDHECAAQRSGLSVDARLDLAVGPGVKHFYEAAGVLSRYERDYGLPLLLALRYRR